MIRSFPFTILVVALIPFTRIIMGTSIGSDASIIPLTIAVTPFVARLFETNFKEVNQSVIDAAISFAANRVQVISIIVKESLPGMILSITNTIIYILSLSAMAGVVGGGGLGAVAIIYGYQSFNDFIMYIIVLILIILVQLIQFFGHRVFKKTL